MKLEEHTDWNIFVPILDVPFSRPERRSKMRRPSFDRLMLFKILILQNSYSLSDNQMEHHYGYKNHVKVDQGTKLVDSYMVTDASSAWLARTENTDRQGRCEPEALRRQCL